MYCDIVPARERSRALRIKISSDKGSALQILEVGSIANAQPPIVVGRTIRMSLAVTNIRRMEYRDERAWTWSALLVPAGIAVGGLIRCSVEQLEQ